MIKKIRRSAYTGLIGSVAIALAAICFCLFCQYRFYMTDEKQFNIFMIIGVVLSVLDITAILMVVRKSIPRLRQTDSLDQKLSQYASLVSSMYYGTLFVVLIVSTIVVISNNTRLIMLILLTVLMLFLLFPNMYKIKADLGLNDEQMKGLFGNDYIPDNRDEE